jgi:XTP/dITP diphosphohydrolase
MKELVIATNNLHKIKEIFDLANGKIKFISLKEIGCKEQIPEEQNTLEGNARQKARFVFEIYGLNCFADDTGLEVESLNWQPGVYSARYAGESCSFEDNIRKLLKNMDGKTNRKARFRTIICLIEDGEERYFEGVCNGQIIEVQKGLNGFGYDSVFMPDSYNKTFAQMTLEEKNTISHRSRATEKLLSYLCCE